MTGPQSSQKFRILTGKKESKHSETAVDRTGMAQPPEQVKSIIPGSSEYISELNPDTVQQLLQRMQVIETTLSTLLSRMEELQTQVHQDAHATLVETGALRNELLGKHKALGALGVFNGVIQELDNLQAMRSTLRTEAESAVYRQVDSLVDSLTMMLRGLGFIEFDADMGEAFNPMTMECTGYTSGLPGIVLGLTRKGYKTQAGVVRPVGVLIADPDSSGCG